MEHGVSCWLKKPKLIELLDFAIGVNRHGWDDLPASALSKREVSPAPDNQSRAEQS
jgi:hypothetical protein